MHAIASLFFILLALFATYIVLYRVIKFIFHLTIKIEETATIDSAGRELLHNNVLVKGPLGFSICEWVVQRRAPADAPAARL